MSIVYGVLATGVFIGAVFATAAAGLTYGKVSRLFKAGVAAAFAVSAALAVACHLA